ncbi:ABC1 kinase family protein [Clostridium fallax]|uniref:Ubiquinone biosynthesis protein n=1 Tax=Clostridium fallax TaxID=1533 RepID=A0A1M4TAS5_9CLOT|nr:AarF/ABC1/UbiB kinase family protein [Clostridium fallax]SHE41347.1 ubiquinone biosynthesis protein [Clostridium fallax]SQB22671.1 putative unusual protein kinase [Clostridium fallax]
MKRKAIDRFKEIVEVLGKYGFGYIIDSKLNNQKNLPENLRKAFEELGPTFIKIGQILSTRPDILPKRYIKELRKLQDEVPEEKIGSMKEIFSKQLGKEIPDIFETFNEKPLASASVAQVYEGTLKDGRDIVIKIQRPDIEEKMDLDISILMRIFKFTKPHFQDMLVDPIDALKELKKATKKELNFKLEKDNMEKFKKNNAKVAYVYVPYLVEEFCTEKIITMEKINGLKINDKYNLLKDGYDLNDIGKKLALSFCKQVFDDGFFHGDPHPGNLLIRGGKICYIDFGLVGDISKAMVEYLNEGVFAVATKNTNGVVDFLLSVGLKKGKINRNDLYEGVDYMLDMYLSTSLKNIKISLLLQEIFELAQKNNIQLPREFIILIRSMVLLEGVVTEISPDLEVLDILIPYIKQKGKNYILKNLNKDKITMGLFKFTKDSSKVPSKFVELSDSIVQGRAKINLQIDDIDNTMNQLNKMVNRIVFGFIVGALIVGSSLIVNMNIGPQYRGISILAITGYLVSAVFALYLLISIIRSGNLK